MDLLYRVFCPTSACTPAVLIDLETTACVCTPTTGRIGEFIMLKCTASGATPGTAPTDVELASLAQWTTWVTAGDVRRSGKGIGSLQTTTTDSDDLGGCSGTATATNQVHEFTFQKKCINISGATGNDIEFANQVARGALSKYNVFLRLCDDTETLILMGVPNVTTPGNLVIPAGRNENAYLEYKFEKRKLGPLGVIKVVGLNSVLPPQV